MGLAAFLQLIVNRMNIKLTFGADTLDVPITTTVTRRIMRLVEEPLKTIKMLGANTAFLDVIKESPEVLALLTPQGGYAPQWEASTRALILSAYPDADNEFIAAELAKRLQGALAEYYPRVLEAINNPTTAIDITNDAAVQACIDIVRTIVDTTQLTTEQKAALATLNDEENGTNDFWDVQDIKELVNAVMFFRGMLQS